MIPETADDKFAPLRRQAEEILHDQPANLADLSPADIQALLHNLQVHQVELELQNEELRAAQLELQIARDRYADLYNFAPVGYFTLDVNGVIVEANLTGANLLGMNRSALVGTPFTRFVVKEDHERYADYRVGLGTSAGPQTIEIRLVRPDGAEFYAHLEGLAVCDDQGKFKQSRLTLSDVTQRKQAEEMTCLSEEKFAKVFAACPEAISVTSVVDARYIDVNDVFLEATGFRREEVIGHQAKDLGVWVELHDRGIYLELMRSEGRLRGFETRFRMRSNEVRHFQVSAEVVDIAGEKCYLHFIQDITERKQAEEQLRYQANLLQNVSDAIIATDLSFTITSWNQAAERLYGWSAAEVMGRPVQDILQTEYSADLREQVRQRFLEQGLWQGEAIQKHKDGTNIYVMVSVSLIRDSAGQALGAVAVNRDITERKQAGEALRESEEKYRTVFQNSLDAILLTSPDGSIYAANSAACKMFGRTEAEICRLGRSCLVDPNDPRLKVLLAERTRTGKTLGELTMLRQDGSPFPAELSSALFQDRHGNTRTSIIIRDITERKQAEESLYRYTERLRHLHELDLDIVAARSPGAIVQTTLKRLRRLIPCQRTSVILFDFEAQEALVLTVEVSGDTLVPAGLHQPLESGWVAALQRGQTLVVEDTLVLAQPVPVVKILRDEGIRSYINVPLLTGSELLGVVNLGSDLPGTFKAEYIEIAEEATIVLAIALEQARLHEQVSRSRARLEVLSRRLLEAQETERRHIARELHDEIGQNLSMIKIDLQTMQQLPQARPLAAQLGESISNVERVLHQVRTLSVELRPSLLDDLGLIPALRWYTDRQAQRGGFTARFGATPLQARLTSEMETVCYRLVQEALTNVVRHAQARQVEVELQQREAELWLFIRDDGLGFDVAAALKQAIHGTSLGLLSMQDRVLLIGGQLELKSVPGQGTVIQARLPLKYAPPVNLD